MAVLHSVMKLAILTWNNNHSMTASMLTYFCCCQLLTLSCFTAALRAMDKAEREDRMKRAELKRKEDEQKRR